MADSTDLTDEAIAKQVQHGDIESFGLLMKRYEAKISRYARKFLFSSEDADDRVQDVFMKAYANIKSFNTQERFSPWIYRIAHNEFINALKKRGGEPLFYVDFDTLLPHPIAKEEADSEAKRRETQELMETGLNKLTAKYREPLILYYYQDLEYAEIADILQLPVSTVGVRLRRGRDMLKKHIDGTI